MTIDESHWKYYLKKSHAVAILDGQVFAKWAEGELSDYECMYQFRLNNGMGDEVYINRKEFFEWIKSLGYHKGLMIIRKRRDKRDTKKRYEVHNNEGLIYIGTEEEICRKMKVTPNTVYVKLREMRNQRLRTVKRKDSWWLMEEEE